jgi:hypothetical protein
MSKAFHYFLVFCAGVSAPIVAHEWWTGEPTQLSTAAMAIALAFTVGVNAARELTRGNA